MTIVKQTSLSIDQEDAVYISTRQTWFADDTLSFVIRARGNAAAIVPAVKSAIRSVDRNSWFSMLALLMAVAILACWVPAWRGASVDPSTALRSE